MTDYTPDLTNELLRYVNNDLRDLTSSIQDVISDYPKIGQEIAVEAMSVLGKTMGDLAVLLSGGRVIPHQVIEAEVETADNDPSPAALIIPPLERPSNTLEIPTKRIGNLIDDPAADKKKMEIAKLRSKILHSGWGIEELEDLEQIVQIVYGLDLEDYLDETERFPLALPQTHDFAPYQLVLSGNKVVCAEGEGAEIKEGRAMLLLNLFAFVTYFGGLKSSVFKQFYGSQTPGTVSNGSFYSKGYKAKDVLAGRGNKQDWTYTLHPNWQAGTILGSK